MDVCVCVSLCCVVLPWRWTDPPPKESYQVTKGSISEKKNPTPEKGIRNNEEEEQMPMPKHVPCSPDRTSRVLFYYSKIGKFDQGNPLSVSLRPVRKRLSYLKQFHKMISGDPSRLARLIWGGV
jgi:hypothetical protein